MRGLTRRTVVGWARCQHSSTLTQSFLAGPTLGTYLYALLVSESPSLVRVYHKLAVGGYTTGCVYVCLHVSVGESPGRYWLGFRPSWRMQATLDRAGNGGIQVCPNTKTVIWISPWSIIMLPLNSNDNDITLVPYLYARFRNGTSP